MKSLNNTSGFSLMEAMLGMALMSFAALGLMNFMQSQQKAQKTLEMNSELRDIRTIIQQTIATKDACEATFIGMAPGDNLKEIRTSKDLTKPSFLKAGERFRQYNIYVKSIHMLSRDEQKEPSRNIQDAGIESNGVGYAFVEVTFGRGAKENGGNQNYYGGREIKVVFPIRGVFANYSLLAGCQKDSTLPDQCKQSALTQGAGSNYTANFVRETTAPFAEKVFDINGCVSPGGYMLECSIFKDTFPITSCEV